MSKSLTHLTASLKAGPCTDCRHANQETADFREGHVFCALDPQPKARAHECDVMRDLFVSEARGTRRYFLFEPYDGANGTYGRLGNRTIVPEDASEELKARTRNKFS